MGAHGGEREASSGLCIPSNFCDPWHDVQTTQLIVYIIYNNIVSEQCRLYIVFTVYRIGTSVPVAPARNPLRIDDPAVTVIEWGRGRNRYRRENRKTWGPRSLKRSPRADGWNVQRKCTSKYDTVVVGRYTHAAALRLVITGSGDHVRTRTGARYCGSGNKGVPS